MGKGSGQSDTRAALSLGGYMKYPRTPHLPWSPGASDDDLILDAAEHFADREIVVTEKLDGENTTLYRDHIHARSLDSAYHPSRTVVKQLHGQIQQDIPEGWRICGENMYAEHSVSYDRLPAYLVVFSVWNERNQCLSWDQTKEWTALLGLSIAPTLYQGVWDIDKVKQCYPRPQFSELSEGYVVRLTDGFYFDTFQQSIAKFVRKGHVQTEQHWMHQQVTPNGLIRT